MSQASTKIEDLPDEQQMAEKILRDLDIQVEMPDSDEEVSPLVSGVNNKSSDYNEIIKSFVKTHLSHILVFAVVFLISNKNVINLLSKVKFISDLPAHGLVYNSIVAGLALIVFMILEKVLEKVLLAM